jgi:hypothetical protein
MVVCVASVTAVAPIVGYPRDTGVGATVAPMVSPKLSRQSRGQRLDSNGHRVDIPTAARLLGLTETAVRKRVQRRKLPSMTIDGRVYILVDQARPVVTSGATDATAAGNGATASPQVSIEGATADATQQLVEVLQAEVARLQRELDTRNEELAKTHAIIMRLAERPALPAGEPARPAVQTGETPPWWATFWPWRRATN